MDLQNLSQQKGQAFVHLPLIFYVRIVELVVLVGVTVSIAISVTITIAVV